MTISTTVTLPRSLTDTAGRQLPFAIALALTRTAQDAQAAVRDKLPGQFHLKNTWTQRQIRIVAANKATLTAEITAPDYMAKQETGGVIGPTDGRHLAGPAQPLQGRILRRGLRPRAQIDKGAFIRTTPQGTSIAQRRPGGHIRILYWLTGTQEFQERFHMGQTVADVVRMRFESRLAQAIEQAINTAR